MSKEGVQSKSETDEQNKREGAKECEIESNRKEQSAVVIRKIAIIGIEGGKNISGMASLECA
eukprot:6195611-Pleurochrysis_carterae.AAC.4